MCIPTVEQPSTMNRPAHCHDNDDDDHHPHPHCTVQFAAKVDQVSSNAFHCHNTTSQKEEVERFFASPTHRHLFLAAGGKNKCEKVALTPELLAEWRTRCQYRQQEQDAAGSIGSNSTTTTTTTATTSTTTVPTRLPDESDEVYAVQTSGMKIPGLTVEVWVTVGIQKLQLTVPPAPTTPRDNDVESAETRAPTTSTGSSQTVYQVTLIGEKRQAKGLRFFTYLYNKMSGSRRSNMTGKASPENNVEGGGSDGGGGDRDNSSHTECTTRIGYTFWDHNDDPGQPLTSSSCYVTFEMSTDFRLTLQFPKVVLRMLPTSQEKAEAQGSKAIANAIRNDSQGAMTAFESAYRTAFPTTTTLPSTKVMSL
jgi:hypothetical protein